MRKRQFTVRVSDELAARIDRMAAEHGITKQAFLSLVVALGVNAAESSPFVDKPKGDKR